MRAAKFIILFGVILGGLCWFLYSENHHIQRTQLDLFGADLPAAFEGFTIVHLSDFHNQKYGPDVKSVIPFVENAHPDLIAFTGDLVDSRNFRPEPALELMRELVPIAPVYYVPGNHEWATGRYEWLETQLRAIGVRVLRNERDRLTRDAAEIAVLGIDDPIFQGNRTDAVSREITAALEGLKPEAFTVLLSHRPEVMPTYADLGLDIVLTGHAHGGQVRLPLVGGLVAPHQGLFPTYDAGVYEMEQTRMVVHRGLGNSIVPLRLFNRPEVVVIRLHGAKSRSEGE